MTLRHCGAGGFVLQTGAAGGAGHREEVRRLRSGLLNTNATNMPNFDEAVKLNLRPCEHVDVAEKSHRAPGRTYEAPRRKGRPESPT
jgi:hypothetical protein